MGVSDTSVVTTGLDVWSMSEPAAILPRGPIQRARQVAGAVLGDAQNPFCIPLRPHPPQALRRRLWWATVGAALVGGVLATLALPGVLSYQWIWAAAVLWPVNLLAAVIAYRALGHTITDRYVITRSGLLNRATTVLERSAVSTIVIQESLLQRRLNLRSVSTMTAAGYGGYDTPDLDRQHSLEFAVQAAPGLLDPSWCARLRPHRADRPFGGLSYFSSSILSCGSWSLSQRLSGAVETPWISTEAVIARVAHTKSSWWPVCFSATIT